MSKEPKDNEHEWGEAVSSSSGDRPKPGDIILDNDSLIAPEPLVGADQSTPLQEDEPEGNIPPGALWAMKDRRHIQWHLLPHDERHDRVREVFGSGDLTVYGIDDGKHHAMVAHLIGESSSGVTYALIGRVDRSVLATLASSTKDAFATAKELTLVGVAQEESIQSSNVFDVDRYDAIDEIPESYLPGGHYETFSRDLEIAIG